MTAKNDLERTCGLFLEDASEDVNYDYTDYPVYIRDGLLSSYCNYAAQAHWHDDVELIYIRSGEMIYNINGNIVALYPGEGIFVNSRQIHYGFSDHKECDFLCIVFNPSILCVSSLVKNAVINSLTENLQFPYCKLQPAISWQKKVLRTLSSVNAKDKSTAHIMHLQSKFYHIWELLFENMPEAGISAGMEAEHLSTLRTMLDYIRINYMNHVTLLSISASGNICESKCCRLFQEYLQTTPISFLNSHRIKIGMELLRNSSFSVTEIADLTGISGVSYFSELFRQKTGHSPREYRKRILEKSV